MALVYDADKAEALKLGRHPDLTGEILRDMEQLGMIGEDDQQADWLSGDDHPQDGRPAGLAHFVRQRRGQESFAGHRAFALSRTRT